jgi:TonB-linked SusC/RagA family outer membrane protein
MVGTSSNVVAATQGVNQARKVTGQVLDEHGEPLIGASISVDGKTGAVTDIDGNFTLLNVPDNATVTVTYVGYKEAKVSTAGKTQLNITMQPDDKTLDDVVVIGYGVQKKSNVTGAIASVKAEDLANKVDANAAASLQGKVSGVQVINNSGAPGSSPTIRVRGYSSNGSSDPLYVVDGLKVSSIDYLEPSSIESIEVLKDAASAAIYGAEAGNGVVLITTKSGSKGDSKTSINFDMQLTYSTLADKVDLMNASQFIEYNKEANSSFETLLNRYYDGTTDNDWQDDIFKTGVLQKYNLSVSGGNKNGSFFVAGSYYKNNGMIISKRDQYRRVNLQINASYNIRPWLEVGTNNTLSDAKTGSVSESSAAYGLISNILKVDPLTPVEYEGGLAGAPSYVQDAYNAGLKPYMDPNTGNYYGVSWIGDPWDNPVRSIYTKTSTTKAFGISGMTYANIKPIKGLVFTTRLGYRYMNYKLNRYDEEGWGTFGTASEPLPYLNNVMFTRRYWQWENFANYNIDTSFGNWTVMAGMSYINNESDNMDVNTNGLSNTASNFRYLDYSSSTADDNVGGYGDIKRQIAYYGRLTWSFLDRYNVQFNFRADSYDASYLDLDHNWGYFPSVSAGWIFTEEDFMKNLTSDKGLTYGKLRLSWGKNGSISNLGGYMYASALNSGAQTAGYPMAISQNSYYMDGKLVTGTYPNEYLANPKLKWEESKQFDAGLDLRFFNGKLATTIDYYYKITDGLLVRSTAPLTTGTTYVYQNLGKVRNTGLEFEATWQDNIGDFSYSVKGNLSTVSNKVTEYRGEGVRIAGTKLPSLSNSVTAFEEGYPIWYIRGYKYIGVNEETGEPIYQDMDGDGNITDADRTNLGDAIPDFTYGLTINLKYKGFDLSAYGAGSHGSEIFYGMANGTHQKPMFLYNGRWTSSNTTGATMPSALYQDDEMFYNSSAFVFSGNYFKIKQIQLGYTLPKSVLKKLTLTSARIYMSLDNFFTFTDYPGFDPEVRGTDASAMAVDFGGYPISKSVSFGLNVTL